MNADDWIDAITTCPDCHCLLYDEDQRPHREWHEALERRIAATKIKEEE